MNVRVDGVMVATAVAVAGGVFIWVKRAEIGKALNPSDRDNLVYRGVNAIGDVFDDGGDNDSFSFGSWVYDIAHPGEGVQ